MYTQQTDNSDFRSLKFQSSKIYEIILCISIFINLLFETEYAFSRKLISLFFCVLDYNFQTLPNDLIFLLLLCCGDTEHNTGPKTVNGNIHLSLEFKQY